MADTHRLPVPVTEVWDWQVRGACRGMDSAFFFHPEGERGPAKFDREARAKQVCGRCVVLEECRRHALSAQEPYGVWGGLTEAERDVLIRGHERRLRIPGRRPTPAQKSSAQKSPAQKSPAQESPAPE